MSAPSHQPSEDLTEVEFGLSDYVGHLWRHKWIFAAVAIATSTVAAIHTKRTPNLYEATCTLIFTPPGAGGAEASRMAAETGAEAFSPNWALYRDVAGTNEVMLDIIKEFGLDQPPYTLSPEALSSMMNLKAAGGERLLQVVFRYTDPDLVHRIANYTGQALVNLSRKVRQNQLELMKTSLEADLKVVAEKMNELAKRFAAVQQGADIAVLRAEVERTRSGLKEAGGKLDGLKAEIVEAEARLEVTKHALATEPLYLGRDLKGAAAVDRPAAAGGASGSQDEGKDSMGRTLPVNPAYTAALQEKFGLEKDLAGLNVRLRLLTQGKDEGTRTLRKLEPEVGRLERDLALLETQYEVLSTSYKALAKKLEETRLMASSTALPDLVVLDPALPPKGPIAPSLRRNLLTANLFTFGLAAFVLVLVRVIGARRGKNAAG